MAARADILEKVKKSRQEAERRIQESNKKDEQARQASQREYQQNTSSETKQAASYMKQYSTPERAGNTVSDYAQKRKQLTSWYKGDKPTEIETLAKIVKETERDRAFGEKLYGYYEQAKQEGEWAETYDKATSRYAAALGLPEGTAINDEFFDQMKPYFAAGVTTDAGNLSTAKKNGADALFAANLAGLYDDYQKTKTLKNESDNMFKEIQYWVAQGLTDDEIRKKVDIEANGAYGNLRKAKAKTATGEYEPTTEAIPALTSYGVDGMIWAARNPGKSTGDYKLDAVQGAMGRGSASPTQSDPRRDISSASYAPYAVGMSGMDEYGIKYGRTSFDEEWLNSPAGQAVRNNPETNKDFGVIYDTVEKTKKYKVAVDEFMADVRADIEAGVSPDEIFSPEMLDDYPEIRDLLEAQAKGNPIKTSESLNFDLEALYKEAETAYVKNVGKVTSEEFEDDLSEKLGTPSKKNSATAGAHTQTQQQLMAARSIFARSATPEEKSVFATYSPGYADTKTTALDGILNGTSEDNQAFYSAMGAADNYAASEYLPARKKLDELQSDLAAIERHEAYLEKWDESKYADQVDEDGRPLALSAIYGNDEFLADQAADEGDLAVWKKYHGDTTGLKAEIAAQEKILGKIKSNYEDAAKLNANGVSSGTIMPMLEFIEQFDAYVPQRFADTEWGYRMAKGESWEQVRGSLDETRANNMYLIKMIDTAISQAEKYGIGDEYLKGMKRARQTIEEENRLIDYEKLRDQKDFMSAVEAFNDTQEPYKPGNFGISFGAISREEDIRNAVVDLESYILTGRGEQNSNAPLVAVMSDSELNTYKYLFETKGEAEATAYFDSLTPMLNVRQSESFKQRANDYVDTWYGAVGANIASVAINALTAVPTLIASAGQAIKGEVDPYSAPFWLNTYSQSAREETKNNISSMTEKQFGKGSRQEKLALFGYEAVMTGLDSYASGKLGSAFAGVGKIADVEAAKKVAARTAGALMSANAGATSLMDAKMRGAADWQAFAYAGITGLTEYYSEKIPMETWLGIEEGDFKTFWKSFVEGVATDAPGEMLSEVAGTVSDKIIMQELSNWDTAYEQYRAMGMSDTEARSQRLWDTVNNILYAGMLSVGTTAISTGLKSTTIKVFGGKKKFKTRAETALYEAAAKSASKGDTAATVEAVMEAMGSDPVEASAAAHVLANVDPNVASTTASILAHTEDPSAMDALRLGALVPDSQTGQILSDIQQNGATDENVADLIEVSKLESDVPEIQSQYGEAVKKNVEAMAVVNALLGTDNKPIEDAKAAVTKAEENLATQRKTVSDAEAEMQAATNAMDNAKKRFNAKPSDPKAKSAMEKSVVRYQEAQKTLEDARSTTDIGKAVEELKAARKALETTRNELMTAARANAQTVVQDNMVQMQQRKAEALAVADEQRQADNIAALDVEEFIDTNYPNASEEQKEQIRSQYMSSRSASAPAETPVVDREKMKKGLSLLTKASKKFGFNVVVTDKLGGAEGAYRREGNTIYVAPDITQTEAIKRVLIHEMTHASEASGNLYEEMRGFLLGQKYGGDQAKLRADIDAIISDYNAFYQDNNVLDKDGAVKKLTEEQAMQELTADICAEIISGNEEMINKLVSEAPSLARRIMDAIVKAVDKLRGVKDPSVEQAQKAVEMLEKALNKAQTMQRSFESDGIQYSLREKEPPKKVVYAYKAFYAADGKLYPPMVSNITDESDKQKVKNATSNTMKSLPTPVGVWLDADIGGIMIDKETGKPARTKDTGRLRVKNDKGGGSLAFRPGWHLGEWPDAKQFNKGDLVPYVNHEGKTTSRRMLMPNDLVFAKCEVSADVDYQLDALSYGISEEGGFSRSQAGLPYVPDDGFYKYRTNVDPTTAPWLIAGSIKVVEILDDDDCARICAEFGVTPDKRENGKKIDLSEFGLKRGPVEESVEGMERFKENEANRANKKLLEDSLNDPDYKDAYVQRAIDFDNAKQYKALKAEFEMNGQDIEEYRKLYEERGFASSMGEMQFSARRKNVLDRVEPSDEVKYNRYRWLVSNGILSGQELDNIITRIALAAEGQNNEPINKDGKFIINTRDREGRFGLIAITNQNYEHPTIDRVYKIMWDVDPEAAEKMEGLIDESEHRIGYDTLTFVENYFRSGVVAAYSSQDYRQNKQNADRGSDTVGGGVYQPSSAVQNGAGSAGETGREGLVNLSDSQLSIPTLPSPEILDRQISAWRNRQNQPENNDPARPQGERQFVRQTMPNTEAVPEWIWREFQNNPDELNYDIDTNREQVERGWQRIQREGHDVELNRLMEAERFSADDTAEANLMMAMALHNDDPATFMALASKYNKEGTEAGKELQARKLFSKMTPTGARIWIAGRLENGLGEFIRGHQPMKKRVDRAANEIANEIRNLDNTNYLRLLESNEDVTINASNNRWGTPINAQQQALIDRYNLNNVARPGIFYNRATTEQRMLEAILATPNPLEITGNGLNLIQRLEFMQNGAAVVTNADLNYIGARLGEFIGNGAESGGRNADVAIARAYEAFGNITLSTTGEKYRTWRYISMLTSVPSALRNVIGNVTMNAVNATAHGVAVEIDKIVSSFTGHRTAEHLSVNERVAGWNAFVEETKNTFRDYFVDRVTTQRGNDRYSTNQRGRVFQSSALEAVRNVESFMMSFGDRNVWRKAYVNSLAEQQKLADQNLLFNADGTTRTHDQMIEQAERDANYATFSESNRMSNLLGQMKQIPGLGHVVDFIMPFTGVPVNITNRMIQYSPATLATTVLRAGWQAAHGQTFDQQAFVQGLSRGLTGTALFGVGLILAEMGAIKLGTGEEEDKKKYGLQTAMGEQYTPYIYNPFTDEYVSLAVFSPAASSLTMGAAAWMDFKNNDNALQALKNAAFGSIDQIFDASYMSGLADLFGGYGSFGKRLLNTLFNNVVSQSVPTVLGQLANSMDPYVRDTKDKSVWMQAIKSGFINKIPFLREQLLPVKIDVTGQPVRTKEGLRNFYDPFTTTDARNEPVVDELFRLNEVLGSSSMLPSDVLSGTKNSYTFNKQTVTLSGGEKEAYRRRYGELWLEGGVTIDKKGKRKVVRGLRDLMASTAYSLMDDDEKKDAIEEIIKAADVGVKMEFLRDYGNR